MGYRRSKGRRGNKALRYEAILIWTSDTGCGVHEVDLRDCVIWQEEKMVQEPAVLSDLWADADLSGINWLWLTLL